MLVSVSIKVESSAKEKVPRLRETIRKTNHLAPLTMTALVALLFIMCATASATTYYVSSSTGNNANNGTSSSTPWQTLAHVNGQTFNPGDSVLFRRGDVWNESLVPPSSGTSGNPITFDAYGTGTAPNFTGYYAVPATAWVQVTGNAWKAPLPSTYTTINFCLFGSIWGQKVPAVSSNLTARWDFYLAGGYVYVYSVGPPALYYNEPIVPMALSNSPVININGQSWLTFQHFLVNWFDQYGVYVQGASDHLVFANMEADSMIPQGTQPLGFYVDESTPGPGDIKIYNSEAHLNYDGFRFDGAATAITMVNDKAYANRDGALVDNTGAVTYSYCHFYASSLAVAGSTDVEWTSGTGPTVGAYNIPADTAPAVQVYQRYPAEVTLTVDDAGMTPDADTYYANTVLPVADAAGVPVGAAITVGYPLAQTLISEFQGWVNAGRDLTSHSISHTYYTNTDALEIQYTGSGTGALLSISGKTLTIAVSGAPDGVSYNLAQGETQGTMLGLAQALAATGKFTTSFATPCQGPYGTGCSAYTAAALLAQDLADVSGQDVRTSVYHMQLDVTRLTTDEITLSRQWMTTNLTGLPTTPVYVYPGGYETTTMQGITAGVPYTGARGALKQDLGVKDTYADGFNAENITSFGVNPSWMAIPPAALNQHIQALVWKESVWGVPWGIFWHLNELINDDPVGGAEITNLIQDFKNSGATIQTNTSLVNWLRGGTEETGTDGNDYYKLPAASSFSSAGGLDFRPTKNSPVVDAGQNLGAAYELDINGINQNSYGIGWEIGAHVFVGYSEYGGDAGSGSFVIGNQPSSSAQQLPQLPRVWVDNNEATDGLLLTPPQYELNLGTEEWVTAPPSGCTFHVPYWTVGTPTFAGLQSAINDDEACRTAQGGSVCTTLDIPPAVYAASAGLVIPQTNSSRATCVIILRSTEDSSLPNGQTVGAHGIQDNCFASATDIGIENPDLTGENMYYACGPTSLPADTGSGTGTGCVSASMSGTTATFTLVSSSGCNTVWPASFTVGNIISGGSFVPSGYNNVNWTILSGGAGSVSFTAQSCPYVASPTCVSGLATTASTGYGDMQTENIITGITTLSVTTTTLQAVTSAEVSAGIPILVPLANGFVSPCGWPSCANISLAVDTGGSAETVIPLPGANQIGIWAIFTKTHAFGVAVTYNVGSFTLANGTSTNTSNYNDLQYMWQLQATGANPALSGCSPLGTAGSSPFPCGNSSACPGAGCIGPDHWLIEDAALSPSVGSANDIDILGELRTNSETSNTQLSSHIHARKLWLHGDYTSLFTGSNVISDAMQMSCVYCSLLDSQISQVLRPGAEGHIIGTGLGTSLKIDHNWGEGQSSCIFSGGFSSSTGPSIPNYVPYQDIEVRRNQCGFPYPWLGLSPIVENPNIAGSLVRKNLEENKEGERILYSGNYFQNSDSSGGQGGPQAAMNLRSTSGGGTSSNYQATLNDVSWLNNILRNSCEGPEMAGASDASPGNGGGVSLPARNFWLNDNLYYNATTTNPGCAGVNSTGFSMGGSAQRWQGTITSNGTTATFTATCSVNDYSSGSWLGTCLGQLAPPSVTSGGTGCAANGAVTINPPNIATGLQATATYQCSAGAISGVTLTAPGSGYTSVPSYSLPAGVTGTIGITLVVSPAAPGVGYQVLDLLPSQPFTILGCQSIAGFNQSTFVSGGNTFPVGPGYSSASGSSGLTVSWPSSISGTDSSGYCTLANYIGTPQNFLFTHNTFITDSTHTLTSTDDNANAHGPNYQTNALLRDSIMLGGGWYNNPLGEGTSTETFNFDSSGSLSANHLVWPTRTNTKYTEFGNNASYPDSAGCTGSGCNPPVTMYFPATPYCSGSSPNSACVGFIGAMSASSMPLTLPDYHAYSLITGSVFKAGGSEQASDGTDMGVNIPALDAAQTANTFVCPTSCGSPGPYPDTATGVGPAPQFFGFSENDTNGGGWPSQSYGMQRFWDSPCTQWPDINTASGVFNFTCLDADLALAHTEGTFLGFYTLARTPTWASSNPTDTTCNYTTGMGGGDGECDPPSDLASNGSGTDAIWKAWITAIATHVNNPTYLQTHAHIKYWEIWNEPDTQAFWNGSIAQLARLTEDANCIITGRGVIHQSGNGTATTCTATPIDPTAQIVMASAHAKGAALVYGQNELYCNNTFGIPSYELPCPNPANAIAAAVDVIDFHMKPGSESGNNCPSPTPCTMESAMQWYISNIDGILQPAELAKPLWDGEAQYSPTGFTGAYSDPDMAASFIPRFYLESWTLGLQGIAWYYANSQAEPVSAETSYQQVYNWLQGTTLTAPCAASGTVWSCQISQNGTPYLVMWDTSQSCSGGFCTTGNQTVGSPLTAYQNMTTASTPIAITGHSVPIGIKPVLIH